MVYEDGSVGACYHGDFSSNRQVSVRNARLGLWGVYDRYFASTRKVSLLTPPNGRILVERMKIPCDSASEAPCRRDLVLCRGTRRHDQRYSPTGSVSLSRYYPAMGRSLGNMAPHRLSHTAVGFTPRGLVPLGVLCLMLFEYSRSIGHELLQL